MVSSSRRDFILGIDVGGTKTLTVVADAQRTLIAQRVTATPSREGPGAVVQALVAAARDTCDQGGVNPSQVKAVGVAFAGLCDGQSGVVYTAPNFQGWRNVPLARLIRAELGVATYIGNDANLAALGEHVYGAGKNTRHMIFVTVSTGIGGGIIIDGKLYEGCSGTAGEIGHTTVEGNGPLCGCGRRGCLEAFSSGSALAREAREHLRQGKTSDVLILAGGKLEEVSARTIFRAAEGGDPLCRSILERGARYLGMGFVNLVHLFNPEMLIVAGGLSAQWELYIGPAVRFMKSHAFERPGEDVQVVPSSLGDVVGVMGALALVQRRLVSRESLSGS